MHPPGLLSSPYCPLGLAEYVKLAVEADTAQEYQSAIDNYIKAIEYFNAHLKYDKNPASRDAIRSKVRTRMRGLASQGGCPCPRGPGCNTLPPPASFTAAQCKEYITRATSLKESLEKGQQQQNGSAGDAAQATGGKTKNKEVRCWVLPGWAICMLVSAAHLMA